MLWPDAGRLPAQAPAWRLFDVPYRDEPEVESGQVLVHKPRCWAPLLLCLWYSEHAQLFYRYVYGDKEAFHLAFRRLDQPYAMTPQAMTAVPGAFYQHDPEGGRLFQHRNSDKWDLCGGNRTVPDFWYEAECRQFVGELAGRWDGRLEWLKTAQARAIDLARSRNGQPLKLAVSLVTCAGREALRAATLSRLAQAGWPQELVFVTSDERRFSRGSDRLTHTAWRALRAALATDADYVLNLEDDVDFNRHLRENLRRWGPLTRRELEIGSLCNLGTRELAWDVPGAACLMHPQDLLGSQAVLFSRRMLEHCLEHWFEGPPDLDLKLGSLAAALRQPCFFHRPSLVQHVGRKSTLGHAFREAVDFDPAWRATSPPGFELVAAVASGRPQEGMPRP